jgi:serine/threonine-protein kinase
MGSAGATHSSVSSVAAAQRRCSSRATLEQGGHVAVKVLLAELAMTLGTERFLREIEVATSLRHPRIVDVLDSGQADGLLYYVMPFVDGGSLRDG